jgi:hypothetical protein
MRLDHANEAAEPKERHTRIEPITPISTGWKQ